VKKSNKNSNAPVPAGVPPASLVDAADTATSTVRVITLIY
jgi:hypothetical protein